MLNPHIFQRLEGLLQSLNSTSTASHGSASATKGAARSDFIEKFLKQIMPSSLRISTNGQITDTYGNITGELDIIIENRHLPSLPIMSIDSSRLYFSEGVAAVIEVKSNLSHQWNEVIDTGNKIKQIERRLKGGLMMGNTGTTIIQLPNADFSKNNLGKLPDTPQSLIKNKVPYFVVGYHGWSNRKTVEDKLLETQDVVSGILQLDQGFYISNKTYKGVTATGASSLLAFINSIYEASSYIQIGVADLLDYGK